MGKYSDHSTVGGQVLAHRARMMVQNWSAVFMVGKLGFVIGFIANILIHYGLQGVWNYLCVWKAVYRVQLPVSDDFSRSCILLKDGTSQWVSDYELATNTMIVQGLEKFKDFLINDLKFSICVGIGTMIIMLCFSRYLGKSLSEGKELISGHNFVSAQELIKSIDNPSDITLAGVPYPANTESRHTVITGTTGSGKTTVFHEIIRQVLAKKERAVIVDTVGTFVNDYFDKDRDVLLNTLDLRSQFWSLLNECGNNQVLLKHVAGCFVTRKSKMESFWDESAQIVFVEALKKIGSENKPETMIIEMLKRPASEWQQMLKDTLGSSLMDKEAEKMAISIRATLINDLDSLQYLKLNKGNEFSIKQWIKEGQGILFLYCTPKQRSVMIPLISAWLTIAAESMLEIKPTTQRTWFLIDEFHNLRRLARFETYLAEIRKFGGCFVLGTQLISQLNDVYSVEVAKTIIGLCGTKVTMNVPEPSTARYMAEFLGKKEEMSIQESISYGANSYRDGASMAKRSELRDVVTLNDIMDLSVGEAFIRFSGITTIGKVQFEYKEDHIETLL